MSNFYICRIYRSLGIFAEIFFNLHIVYGDMKETVVGVFSEHIDQ